jgi:hypothetical protein
VNQDGRLARRTPILFAGLPMNKQYIDRHGDDLPEIRKLEMDGAE